MKRYIAGLLITALSGCGTVRTLNDEEGAADDLARWKSNCASIPRTYSGAAYQFCSLNGPTRMAQDWEVQQAAFDMALSALADTVLIPYTLYQQAQYGPIPIRRKE
ncbi:YceK/YidQ family lipoprotein [Stutzerimonas azotifigens]|uniref:YceK/YidQ family lipoprotein n=1 Tax=Stutzerimonas azotifigens TaxID=291995 RepID=A0ABR5Z203_9GAMM|nr:YceK/YidQ family lipoprotein [Stutzerimonas azotifigens]MBA1274179.1 YceK/YidQ family lipoprotein [Stutzerimonas azotifigens]